MGKQQARKIAEEYVDRHRDIFKPSVTQKEISQAVEKIAKALQNLSPPEPKLKRTV
jgi:hypothetical protein